MFLKNVLNIFDLVNRCDVQFHRMDRMIIMYTRLLNTMRGDLTASKSVMINIFIVKFALVSVVSKEYFVILSYYQLYILARKIYHWIN